MSSMDTESDEEAQRAHMATTALLARRTRLTRSLRDSPYDLVLYIERAVAHSELGYPDLAAGDAYRALLLTDEVRDEGFEYHEVAAEALRGHEERGILGEGGGEGVTALLEVASTRCYRILAISLLLCGCLKSAHEFCERGLEKAPGDEELTQAQEYIINLARRRLKTETVNPEDFPDQGLVRREVYPWNDYEPDRYSEETLEFLNAELAKVAPKCVALVTELPTLGDALVTGIDTDFTMPTNKQLGLFAKEDIGPMETVLHEISALTVNNSQVYPLCDACSTELPDVGSEEQCVPCEECVETVYCSQDCHDFAMETYHPAVCDREVDGIAKNTHQRETANMLHLLLLGRALAMSATQDIHPLELKEVKYIWGDFLPTSSNAVPYSPQAGPPPVWTLPFSFRANITGPLDMLEKMEIDVFAELDKYDLWIFNTLYSKFRGTASARVNKLDGRPEVAAVHPLWCLANHDCDPNVQWEWGMRMKLWARGERIDGRSPGVAKGEEIMNHYCDIELPVQERREWAKGSLGGYCMCDRCRKEAKKEEEVAANGVDMAAMVSMVNGMSMVHEISKAHEMAANEQPNGVPEVNGIRQIT
ncbi:hypothetical protein VE01_01020 [Pseudogymnoascus verrucosus]|uniref:MYND-type domain-containing protein n=1 Tax=Pseudogymnoascus verrucosus TaxID=342668 RepID=A0A1B8GXH5_9PEZI|nr:uncharacterized protein VE01_01020 [Pseudogymnoascus verrucosus]OBU00553.1 hypothetical protein VE01_01020 [Pseudogymnoascus verrucosus]